MSCWREAPASARSTRRSPTTVQPVSTYVAVTAPIGERLFEAVRYTGAIADTRRAGDYYRIVSDDRLMWGGRISMRGSTPWRLKAALRSDILKVYPQLEGVEIEYAWSGVMAYAVHKMPQIGELAQGYWLASAFGGHGLNTTAMAGEMIARAILEGDDRWRLFSPYELVWAGGRSGRAAAQMLLWSMQARDCACKEKIARYRDRARREADARQIRYEAERAMRKAEAERQRAEEEARRIAEQEARRLAAEEAGRAAAERARQAAEDARRECAAEASAARTGARGARRRREGDARCGRSRGGADAADRGIQGGNGARRKDEPSLSSRRTSPLRPSAAPWRRTSRQRRMSCLRPKRRRHPKTQSPRRSRGASAVRRKRKPPRRQPPGRRRMPAGSLR